MAQTAPRPPNVRSAQNDRHSNRLSLPAVSSPPGGGDRPAHRHERWLLRRLLAMAGHPPLQFRLWNGELVGPGAGDARYTLELTDPGALYQLMGNPNLAFGDLYSSGRLHVDGDLPALMTELYHAVEAARGNWPGWLARLWNNHAPRASGLAEARENVHHHYDLGNEFYSLWLDQAEMQYTCAYYERPDLTLEQAQLAKLEHVCRKLCLEPGQTVVEAGCGWGGLARYMAREYGVTVKAYNISRQQILFAREQAERQGLADRIDYIEDDYRNLSGQYDAFVSVGMLEHVGTTHYPQMAEVIRRSLKPHGLALLHSIGRNRPMPMNAWIEKRIFPGAYPPSIGEFMGLCEHGNFSVLDVENLRLHYARTLEAWLARFDQHQDRVTALYDESFCRAWRMYLAGSIAAFRAGSLQLFQVLFTAADNNRLRDSRHHLYRRPAAPERV